jgi:hypothetical protein
MAFSNDERAVSHFSLWMLLAKAYLGAGLLSLPSQLVGAGWLGAVVCFVGVNAVVLCGTLAFVSALDELRRRGQPAGSFSAANQALFGRLSWVADTFLVAFQLCVLASIASLLLDKAADLLPGHEDFSAVVLAVCLVLLCTAGDLRKLQRLTSTASMLYVCLIVLVSGTAIAFLARDAGATPPPPVTRSASGVISAASASLYVMEGIAAVPMLAAAAPPTCSFRNVFRLFFVVTVGLEVVYALLCFFAFPLTAPDVTDELPLALDSLSTLLLLGSILTGFPLMCRVVQKTLSAPILAAAKAAKPLRYQKTTTTDVGATLGVVLPVGAVLVSLMPGVNLGGVIDFAGASAAPVLGLVVPAAARLRLLGWCPAGLQPIPYAKQKSPLLDSVTLEQQHTPFSWNLPEARKELLRGATGIVAAVVLVSGLVVGV